MGDKINMSTSKNIIGKDSPLRRFPANSDDKQTLFFDGIRYSIEMAFLAYTRLQSTLLDITKSVNTSSSPSTFFVPAILDAWSIVDSVHRLRMLISNTPGIKKKKLEFQVFEKNTAPIRDLRNFVQHLDTQTQKMLGQNLPVWGVLNWLCILDTERISGFTCTLVAGTIFKMQGLPIVNPSGKKIFVPVDFVTLTAGGNAICLSDVISNVRSLLHYLEDELKEQTKEYSRSPEDILVCGKFESKK
jgi:hypothetical protein